MGLKYTSEEIEIFKLRARIRKLQRDFEKELMQGRLFSSMSEDIKINLRHEIKRLQNRLQRIMEYI